MFKDEELNKEYCTERVLPMNCQVNLESLCPLALYFLKSRWNIFKTELVGTLLKAVYQIIHVVSFELLSIHLTQYMILLVDSKMCHWCLQASHMARGWLAEKLVCTLFGCPFLSNMTRLETQRPSGLETCTGLQLVDEEKSPDFLGYLVVQGGT